MCRVIKGSTTELDIEDRVVGSCADCRVRKGTGDGDWGGIACEELRVGVGTAGRGFCDLDVVRVGGGEVEGEEGDSILDVDGERIDVNLEIVDARPRNCDVVVTIVSLLDDVLGVAGGEVDGLLHVAVHDHGCNRQADYQECSQQIGEHHHSHAADIVGRGWDLVAAALFAAGVEADDLHDWDDEGHEGDPGHDEEGGGERGEGDQIALDVVDIGLLNEGDQVVAGADGVDACVEGPIEIFVGDDVVGGIAVLDLASGECDGETEQKQS